jgi:transposase
VHWDTVKRLLKRHGCTYRRARRVPSKTPTEVAQAATKRALRKLHRLEAQGRCQVLYGDECGFSLLPSVPYLWQKPKTRLALPAHPHQKRLSVLGFWRRDNRFWNYPLHERLTAQHFITSIEALMPHLDKPTVLVLDNAPVHRAKCVQEKRAEWKEKGLRLLFLPPYCPHLNRIELLWKQVKYRWLEPQAYVTFHALCLHVTSILDNVGTKYRVTFA